MHLKKFLAFLLVLGLVVPATFVKAKGTGHYHRTGKKVSQKHQAMLQELNELTQGERKAFVGQDDTRNVHCEMLEKAGNKTCRENRCSCTPVWGKTEETRCDKEEVKDCKNACCFRLCSCYHAPPEGCTKAECNRMRYLLRELVKAGVLVETT